VKYEAKRFAASAAVYTTTQPNAYSITFPGNSLATYVVDGRQRNRGIEFSLNGEPVDGLRLIGGATLTDAKLRRTANGTTDGNDAIGVPDYTINGNVEYDLPFLRGVTLTGRVVQTGKQEVNVANTLELPSWTRFDLGGRYVFLAADKPVTLRMTVDNVANKRYWASAFGGYLVQGGPRTFKVSASVDL
jgi:iron complex outermembrane recepter protein